MSEIDATGVSPNPPTNLIINPALPSDSEPQSLLDPEAARDAAKLLGVPEPKIVGNAPAASEIATQKQHDEDHFSLESLGNSLKTGWFTIVNTFVGVLAGLAGVVVAILTLGTTSTHESLFGFAKFCFGIIEEAEPDS